jgi:hypothetical protein
MLTIPIKKKWFDMIISGEKKQDYRDLTPYWYARLGRLERLGCLTRVKFRNGYMKNSPSCTCSVFITRGLGRPEWGAEVGKRYFRIEIDMIEFID